MTWGDIVKKEVLEEALNRVNETGSLYCPQYADILKAFSLVSPDEVNVVLCGQDPFPQKGIATGILFANKENTPEDKLSPSLKVIKNSFLKYLHVSEKDITFDPSLTYIAKQGVLMINSALTVEMNNPGSHALIWRPFTSKLFRNLSNMNNRIIFVLFGTQAGTFTPYINCRNPRIEVPHPAFFIRMGGNHLEKGVETYSNLWGQIDCYLGRIGENKIKWL